MKVKIKVDSLVFVGLTGEQEQELLKLSSNVELTQQEAGLKAQGKAKELYKLLYMLCKTYDIEMM